MTAQAQAEMAQVKTKETIPLWLAVALTVVVALLVSWVLGLFNLPQIPLWAAFIVWAEYFALGAKADALKIIWPAYFAGAILTGLTMCLSFIISPILGTPAGLPLGPMVALFIGVAVMVYIMRFWSVLGTGSLPYFNGISMLLAVYFTGSYPGAATAGLAGPIIAAVFAILAGILGGLLGWFNVTITFPRQVKG